MSSVRHTMETGRLFSSLVPGNTEEDWKKKRRARTPRSSDSQSTSPSRPSLHTPLTCHSSPPLRVTPSSSLSPALCSSSSSSDSSSPGKPDYSAVGAARIEAIQSCSHVKSLYDACWHHWYRYHFVRGRLQQNCQHFFEEYRACILEELEAKGLHDLIQLSSHSPPPSSSSALSSSEKSQKNGDS